jgi:hypothetical protein
VKPQAPLWPKVFDDFVFQSAAWKNVEGVATFWRQLPKGK